MSAGSTQAAPAAQDAAAGPARVSKGGASAGDARPASETFAGELLRSARHAAAAGHERAAHALYRALIEVYLQEPGLQAPGRWEEMGDAGTLLAACRARSSALRDLEAERQHARQRRGVNDAAAPLAASTPTELAAVASLMMTDGVPVVPILQDNRPPVAVPAVLAPVGPTPAPHAEPARPAPTLATPHKTPAAALRPQTVVEGLWLTRRPSRLLDLLGLVTGYEFLRWLFRAPLRAIGLRGTGILTLDASGIQYRGEVHFLGRKIREVRLDLPAPPGGAMRVEQRFRSLYLVVGLLALIAAAWFGTSVLYDGLALGDVVLVGFGVAALAVGAGIDASCYALFHRGRARRLVWLPGGPSVGRALCFEVHAADLDSVLSRLKGSAAPASGPAPSPNA